MLTLTHYSAVSGAGRLDIEIDVSEAEAWGLHQHFEKFCEISETREINWPQSFARRGYRMEDYYFERIEEQDNGDLAYLWLRMPHANPSWREDQTFIVRECLEEAASEVLRYAKSVPVLNATKRFEVQLPMKSLPAGLADEATNTRYFFSRNRFDELFGMPILTLLDPDLGEQLMRGWDEHSSFLVVEAPC
jgi:hypothetical protein